MMRSSSPTTTAPPRAETQRKATHPLIRQTADGWERIEIGTASDPRYVAYAWDNDAWEARQRRADAIRDGLVLEMPLRQLRLEFV